MLRAGKHSVYHAGDTAYFAGFREIGRRLSPELALLPIGAYNPSSFRNVHTDPADAIRAFLDLNARWMVPMHYGSFRLSHEPVDEPLQLLDQEAQSAGIKDRVVVMEEGVTQIFLDASLASFRAERKNSCVVALLSCEAFQSHCLAVTYLRVQSKIHFSTFLTMGGIRTWVVELCRAGISP